MNNNTIYAPLTSDALHISGADATDLLNRILTRDVKSISDGQGGWAFLLDHRGRIKHALILLRESVSSYYALVYDDAARLGDDLDLFVFSEDVKLKPVELSCIYQATLPRESESLGLIGALPKVKSPCLKFDIELYGLERERVWLGEQSEFTMDFKRARRLELLRIARGISSFSEYLGDVSPLDISLRGISEGKGCYPGQEVIERTIALGKPARVTCAGFIRADAETVSHLSSHLSSHWVSEDTGEEDLSIWSSETIPDATSYADPSAGDRPIGRVTAFGAPLDTDHELTPIIVQLKRSVKVSEPLIVSCAGSGGQLIIERG